MTSIETVVSPRKGSRLIHWVRVPEDADGCWPDSSVIVRIDAVCGQKPPKAGWLVVPEGLDHPEYGITHHTCDRCFDRYVGPQS